MIRINDPITGWRDAVGVSEYPSTRAYNPITGDVRSIGEPFASLATAKKHLKLERAE